MPERAISHVPRAGWTTRRSVDAGRDDRPGHRDGPLNSTAPRPRLAGSRAGMARTVCRPRSHRRRVPRSRDGPG